MQSMMLSLMDAADRCDAIAVDALFSERYRELHRVAKRELARPGAFGSRSATTLLQETYIDLASAHGASFPDRARFIGYATRVMRGLVIDHVRRGLARKRGGQFELTVLAQDAGSIVPDDQVLTQISDALDELVKSDASLAELVDLKFFCGFSFAEIASIRGVSERTAQRQWERARLYLHRSLRGPLAI